MKPADKAECFRWVVITYALMFFFASDTGPNWFFLLCLFCNVYWTFRYLVEKRGWWHDGCCTACAGTGASFDVETNGRCWDCYGTGHTHN